MATYNIGPGQTYTTFTLLIATETLIGDDIVDGGGNTFTEIWIPDGSGTSGHPIILRNAVIDGEDARDYCVRTTRNYITIDNITAKNARLEGISQYRGTDITVQNCTLHSHQYASNYPAGVRFFGTMNAIVQNSTFYDIRWNGLQYTSQLAAGDVSGVQILNNTFYDVEHSSIDIKAYTDGNVSDVLIARNKINGLGIYLEHTDTKTISDVTFSFNVITNTENNGISGQTRAEYGYADTPFDNFKFYHNTIHRSGLSDIGYNISFSHGLTNSIFKDNLFSDSNVANTGSHTGSIRINNSVTSTTIDYSSYKTLYAGQTIVTWLGTNYTSISAFDTATGQDANSIDSEPLITDSGQVLAGSPAIDLGVVIVGVNDGSELDLWGNATDGTPNIGADQQPVGIGHSGQGVNKLSLSTRL